MLLFADLHLALRCRCPCTHAPRRLVFLLLRCIEGPVWGHPARIRSAEYRQRSCMCMYLIQDIVCLSLLLLLMSFTTTGRRRACARPPRPHRAEQGLEVTEDRNNVIIVRACVLCCLHASLLGSGAAPAPWHDAPTCSILHKAVSLVGPIKIATDVCRAELL